MLKLKTTVKNLTSEKTAGFTLMELMVAMGIFAIVITIASSILLHSLKTTRFVANQAGAIDNISLAMEQMVREIRTGSGLVWSEGVSQSFTFVNYDGEVTMYSFCGTRMCRNGQPITAANTMIEGAFHITDFGGSKTPRITVAANAEDERGNPLGSVQTSVSARLIYYKDY
jgi:prepilin-type N-terminal cleavage/methylation domain-containing protein